MEIAAAAAAGDGTPPPLPPESGGENGGTGERPKRKMKSPYQLQVLEEAYAVDSYPSEAVRAELSEKIKLTDRQLQMWFCHRRLKDRKVVPQAAPPPVVKRAKKEEEMMLTSVPVVPVSEMMTVGSSSGGAYSRSGGERGRGVGRGGGGVMGKRYYEPVGPARQMLGLAPVGMVPPPAPQLSMAELRVIASVEAQLGETLREDGPILGVEFDPLPPGAFGAPIVVAPHPKQPLQAYNGKHFERHEPKAIKTSAYMPGMEHYFVPRASSKKRKAAHMAHPQAGPRDPHEYQFLPEQPSIRSETYETMPQPHFYDSPVVTPIARVSSSPAGGHYLQGNDPVTPAYTFNGQLSTGTCLTQHRHYSSGSADYDNAPHSNSLANSGADAQFGTHQVLGTENLYLPADPSQGERKRKNEEARIQKEVEAHEKRIRKELEKQDILRRKREEQMRREMERHDRERRKEEERVLREKQREEERLLREQRREIERREKYLQKESLRTEKMRQKEEQRREKEAARLKAATERATARRIAKEYMELVEDERLELLELAASSKGLSSIITLDSETLQQLDIFRGMLHAFPPKSVQLKRPFPNLPWTQVEENIANFFMVWEFLITFADVLGLWSFTMDEFLQSLHDYDSKLLGEIHVALLRSIIKDIEDVARTIAIAMGSNQNAAANPGGGHPKIVEGAYAWGFDIRNWQRHLNFITWPEILRQFAISAGLGPQLKRRTIERPYFRDDNEANGGKDVISTLRNGTAAENAAALMHERGYSNRRRSRHRLTPGTVKFAAFHVLSLEGSKGLTIIEVAEKIQKSGLRDLTTSKTPEASIAAALSRDTKLFERIAPSTYCVRPPFRKDPADADRILSGAREKIQVFQNGLSDSEEAEKDVDDVEEAERDEDSDCDVADDPEVDLATNTDAKLNKNILGSHELKDYSSPPASLLKEKSEVGITPGGCLRSGGKSPLILTMRKSNLTSVSDVPNCQEPSNADAEDIEIDESNFGATWVQGLSEGDYSDLSIDERLDALVALISVANEGNSVRAILEERLEAANSLKKQIWAETQLDKRRYKEEYTSKIPYPSFAGSNAEASQTNAAAEGSQTPTEIIDTKEGGNQISVMGDQFFDPQCQTNFNMSAERNLVGQEFLTNPESLSLQHGFAVEKSRSQLKSYIGHKAERQYVYRSLPLGQDRRRNKYWIFSTGPSPNDPGTGRIFFESKGGFWRILDTEEAFDSLVSALDTRGLRESQLHSMLQRVEPIFKVAVRRNKNHSKIGNSDEFLVKAGTGTRDMLASPDRQTEVDSPSSILCGINSYSPDCSSSFRIEMGRNERERNAFAKRYNGFLKWMWKECYNSSVLCAMKYGKKRCPELLQTCHLCYNCYLAEERHCPSCHKTFKAIYNIEAIFSEHMYQCEMKQKVDSDWAYQGSDFSLPIGVQLLKAQLALIEVSIPKEALQPFWTDGYRKSWGVKLHSSTSSEDLLQLVTLLEHAVKRDYLSSNFETTNELLGFSAGVAENNTAINGQTPCLPWVPETIAAVALRLYDFDSSISYILDRKVENKEKDDGRFIMLPSRSTDIQDPSPNEIPEQVNYRREVTWLDSGSGRRGRGRGTRGRGGGRGRGRGGRGLRGTATYIIPDFQDEFVESYGKSTRKYTRRAVQPRGRGRKRGRRSVRPRQGSDGRFTVAKKAQLGSFTNVGVNIKQNRFEKSPRSSGGNEWGLRETSAQFVDENSGGSQSEDDGLYSGDEYDGQTTNYTINYGQNKPMGMLDDETDEDEEDVDGDEDEDGEEDVDGAQIRHMMMGVDVDDEDEEENIEDEDGDDIGGDVNGDEDDFSSEYSDE